MLIDCDRCAVRGPGCADCVVTAFLQISRGPVDLDSDEQDAVRSLADAGLVAPLRLVPVYRDRAG